MAPFRMRCTDWNGMIYNEAKPKKKEIILLIGLGELVFQLLEYERN